MAQESHTPLTFTHMQTGLAFPAQLEIRAGENGRRTMAASFPYDVTANRSNTGRVRKERFGPMALAWQVVEFQKLQAELAQVLQTSFGEAQAALRARQLELDALEQRADNISPEAGRSRRVQQLEDTLEKRNTHLLVSHDYGKALADMKSGTLAVEHTPARIYLRADLPPIDESPTWVNDAVLAVRGGQLRGVSPGFVVPVDTGRERLLPEPGNPGVMIRQVDDGVAFEYSLIARPTYPLTDVDVREDDPALATPRRRRYWL